MKLAGWRIVKSARAASAFDGEGARLFGGRWNSAGVPMVYTAATASLAALELLVHLQQSDLLQSYSLVRATFDARLVKNLDRARLPPGWRSYPPPAALQQLGDDWIASGESAVLRVPSVVVSIELNYLINPHHRDFARIEIERPQGFEFDARLKGPREA